MSHVRSVFSPDQRARLAAARLQTLHPVPQRARVVRAQALGVPHLQALPPHLLHHRAHMHQLPAREDVLVTNSPMPLPSAAPSSELVVMPWFMTSPPGLSSRAILAK